MMWFVLSYVVCMLALCRYATYMLLKVISTISEIFLNF